MIQEVFYNENRTYIKDTKDSEITTDNLTLDGAFDLALKTHAIFNYDTVDNLDIKYMDNYLMKCSEAPNRSIVNFFDKCEEYGINSIIGNETDTFGMIGARKVISHIIDDYKPIENTMLYNLEAYGTDPYIAQTVYEELKIAQRQNNTVEIKILLNIVDTDEYDLDTFIEAVKKLAPISKQKEEKKKKQIIKLKEKFNDEFGCSTQALDDYVEYLSTFGGDYTSYIADAFNKCFDALIDNEPFCDRDGLIEYLGDLEV